MKNVSVALLRRALKKERKAKLEAENANYKLSKNLTSQREFSDLLIENLVDALFVVNLRGDILKINKEAKRLIGFKDRDLPKNINEFTPVNKNFIIDKFKEQKHKKTITFKFNFVNRDNEERFVTIKSKLLVDENHKPYAYQAIVRDITESQLMKIKLDEQNSVQKFEAIILKDFLISNNLIENSRALVKHVADFLKTDDCVFYGVVNNELVQLSATGDKIGANNTIVNKLKVSFQKGIVGKVARLKKGMIVNDTSQDEDYIVDIIPKYSEITVPILVNNKLIGILDSEHPEKNYYKKFQLEFLQQICDMIGLRLEKAVLELEKDIKQEELDKTNLRFDTIFNNDNNAEVIESAKGVIIEVGNSFLELFGVPISQKSHFEGMKCHDARENLKEMFLYPEKWCQEIDEIKTNELPVSKEIFELKDGRYVSLDYNPIYYKDKLDSHVWTYSDITLNVNFDKSLQEEITKYRSIINNANLGLMQVNNDDLILTVNSAFTQMSGYSEEELLGKKAKDILLKVSDKQLVKSKNIARLKGFKNAYELEVLKKNGESRIWLISNSDNLDISGKVTGSLGIHLDITELKNLISKNESLIGNLTASNEELSHYAHLVSHDLKTPLRTISSCINWLHEDNEAVLNKESKKYIETINQTIKDMDKLIVSTLQFAEIRTNANVTYELIDLNDILVNLIKNEFINFDDSFSINVIKPLPTILFNHVHIKQVFQNLLDNSYKYRKSTRDDCQVSVDWEDQDDCFLFKISDNGIGIDAKHHAHVFEIFKKMNNRTDSSGVGLWIIKKIIESAGGEICYDSQLNIGTTFYFTVKKE